MKRIQSDKFEVLLTKQLDYSLRLKIEIQVHITDTHVEFSVWHMQVGGSETTAFFPTYGEAKAEYTRLKAIAELKRGAK